MIAPRCAVCGGAGALQGHHPTRRPATGEPYLDPKLRLWLCVSCHARCHNILRDEGLDWLPAGTDPLAYRLRTVAVQAGWMGDLGRPFSVADGAASWALRGVLLEATATVERIEAPA